MDGIGYKKSHINEIQASSNGLYGNTGVINNHRKYK